MEVNPEYGVSGFYTPAMDILLPTTTGAPVQDVSPLGRVLKTAANNASKYAIATQAQRTPAASILWAGSFLGGASADGTIAGVTHNGTNASPYVSFELKRNRTGASNSVFLTWNNTTTFNYLTDATARVTGDFLIVGVAASGDQRLYVKDLATGVVTKSSSTVSGVIAYGTNARFEVGDSLNAARHPNAGTALSATFGYALSESEALRLLDNPWQIFKPRPNILYFDVGGGGGATLTPGLLTNTSTFYAPTVTPGAVTLTPGLFSNTSTFYSATVTQGGAAQELTPGLFSNTQTFYAATVAPGAVTLAPALLTNSQTFYAPTVTPGAVTLTPGLFSNTQTFYAATVVVDGGPQTLTPSLVSNTSTFYAATVSPGAVTITPALFANAQTFYAPEVTQGFASQTLTPQLFTNTHEFFDSDVTVGATNLIPDLFVNGNTFYAALLTGGDVQPVVESPAGGGTSTVSGRKRQKLILIERVEEIDELLEQVEEIVQQSPKRKAEKKVKKPTQTVQDSPQAAFDWLAYYQAQLDRLRDQQRAVSLKRQLDRNADMIRALVASNVKRQDDQAMLQMQQDEEDLILLLMAA